MGLIETRVVFEWNLNFGQMMLVVRLIETRVVFESC